MRAELVFRGRLFKWTIHSSCMSKKEKTGFDHYVSARLSNLRQLRSLTQQQVAEASGVSRSTIASIESYHRRPSLFHVSRIVRALGMTLDDVLPRRSAPARAENGTSQGALSASDFFRLREISAMSRAHSVALIEKRYSGSDCKVAFVSWISLRRADANKIHLAMSREAEIWDWQVRCIRKSSLALWLWLKDARLLRWQTSLVDFYLKNWADGRQRWNRIQKVRPRPALE